MVGGMASPSRNIQPADRLVLARPPWGILLLSACVYVALVLPLADYRSDGGHWWALAGAVSALFLIMRQRFATQTWAIVTALCTGLIVASPSPRSALITLVVLAIPSIALYSLAARSSRPRGLAALALSMAALGGALYRANVVPYLGLTQRPACADASAPAAGRSHCLVVLGGLPVGYEIVLIGLGALVVAWALGDRACANRAAAAAAGERATALEAQRAERERAVAADERSRIAAELHDIIAHHISVVALQAGAARMIAESGRPPDVQLLLGVETASRQAMTEIRQALGVIRSSGDAPAPQPGTAHMPAVVERMALAGLVVTIEGSAGVLPSHVDLAVYRIVQESLSNVLRHSAAGTALVTFTRDGEQVEVAVTDNGMAGASSSAISAVRPSEPTDTGGYGLLGLRARVLRLGGQFRAGGHPGGGFEVRARIPVPSSAPQATANSRTAEPQAPGQADLKIGSPS